MLAALAAAEGLTVEHRLSRSGSRLGPDIEVTVEQHLELLPSWRALSNRQVERVSSEAGGVGRALRRLAARTTRLLAEGPHIRSLGSVWLYLRGTSTAKRRAAALAELIEPSGSRRSPGLEVLLALLAVNDRHQMVAYRRALSLAPRGERPLRVLCLDGGGMKGRNLLVMLRALEREAGRPASELFDVVCGTSIGGCGALFLSRFGSNATSRAEVAFRGLQDQCFATQSAKRFFQEGQYCADRRADLVRELLGGVDEPLARTAEGPMAFVVAARRSQDGEPEPFLFRTYDVSHARKNMPPLPGSSNATLVEAIVATSAAPGFFPPCGDGDDFLADGGCAFNNPALVALHECAAIFPSRRIGVLVSLGCGTPRPDKNHGLTARLVYGTDRPEESITHEHVQEIVKAVDGAVYERLDPPLNAYVSPAEHRDQVLDDMEHQTNAWLQQPTVANRIHRIARRLAPARDVAYARLPLFS